MLALGTGKGVAEQSTPLLGYRSKWARKRSLYIQCTMGSFLFMYIKLIL